MKWKVLIGIAVLVIVIVVVIKWNRPQSATESSSGGFWSFLDPTPGNF